MVLNGWLKSAVPPPAFHVVNKFVSTAFKELNIPILHALFVTFHGSIIIGFVFKFRISLPTGPPLRVFREVNPQAGNRFEKFDAIVFVGRIRKTAHQYDKRGV